LGEEKKRKDQLAGVKMADLDLLALLDEELNPQDGFGSSELDKLSLPQITRENTLQRLPASASPDDGLSADDILARVNRIRQNQPASKIMSPGIGTLQDRALPPSTQRIPEAAPLVGKALAEKVLGRDLNPLMNTYPKATGDEALDMARYQQYKEHFDTGLKPSALDKLAELTGYRGVLGTEKSRDAQPDIYRRPIQDEVVEQKGIRQPERDSSKFLGIEKTSPRGWGTSLGMGLAALGDAFSQGGGGRGGFLNRIEDQRKFYETEYRKMYDAEQRHNLAKWTQRLAAGQKTKAAKAKAKEFEEKTKDDQYNDFKVSERIKTLKGNPIFKPLVDMHDKSPEEFKNSFTMNDLKGMEKTLLTSHARARAKGPGKKMSAQNEEALKTGIINDKYKFALGKAYWGDNFLTKYDGSTLKNSVIPVLDKKIKELATKYDKTWGTDRPGEALERLTTSFDKLFETIEKFNGLKANSITYENAPQVLEINSSTGAVLFNGKPLSFPSTLGGVFVDDRGISDWVNRQQKKDMKVSDKEFIGALEGIYSAKRLNDAGKALTAIELKNFKKQMQTAGLTNIGQVMSGVMQLRGAYQKAKERMENNFLTFDKYAPEYFRVRKGLDKVKKEKEMLSRPGAIYEKEDDEEPRVDIYNLFREYEDEHQGWQKNNRLKEYVKKAIRYIDSKETRSNPYYFNQRATTINQKFIRQDKINLLSPEEQQKLKPNLLHQDNWKNSKILAEFSRLGVVK
jgi:hypothetical protein